MPTPFALMAQADARELPVRDKSVHAVVCSPPYFSLRDYETGKWVGGDSNCDHKREAPRWDGPKQTGQCPSGHASKAESIARKTCPKCGATRVDRQIGMEPTPQEFVEAMVAVGREVRRVLRDDGSWWIVIGDTYASTPGGHTKQGENSQRKGRTNVDVQNQMKGICPPGFKQKDLMGVPYRVAIGLQDDGWYWRAIPPWLKTNAMPSSAVDRMGVAHESVLMLTKQPTYYYDRYAVMRPSALTTLARDRYTRVAPEGTKGYTGENGIGDGGPQYAVKHNHETPSHPEGRNWRTADPIFEGFDDLIDDARAYVAHLETVKARGGMLCDPDGDPLALIVATVSSPIVHYAVFPPDLVRPMILASTSAKGCCPQCGSPWTRIVEKLGQVEAGNPRGPNATHVPQRAVNGPSTLKWLYSMAGWEPSCQCELQEPEPCVVLDPFGGSGTLASVANAEGRSAISLDLSSDFLGDAKRRVERPHARPRRSRKKAKPTPMFPDGI